MRGRRPIQVRYLAVLLVVLVIATVGLGVVDVLVSGIPEGACHETPDGGDGCPPVPMPHPKLDLVVRLLFFSAVADVLLILGLLVARSSRS